MRGVRDSTWPFCLGAVQRPAARPDPSAGSWVRALVCSACRAAQFYGGKVTQGPRSHLQARQRRPRQVRLRVYGLEDLSPASAQFAAEAVLTAFALMAAAAGVVDTYSDITGEKWKPYGAAGRRPRHRRPPGGGSRNRRLRARRSGRSGRTAPCRPTVPSPMARRVSARHRSSRLGGGLKKTGRRPLRREPVGTDKKAPAHGARTA